MGANYDPETHDPLLDVTFTIRRPGCTAFATEVRLTRVEDQYRYAESLVQGHEILPDSGPRMCEPVTIEEILEAIEAAE